MGNKFSACGCGQEPCSKNRESTSCKKINKNLIRFWAEIFLLAQDGKNSTKWQIVVPKLVPINLARVQDTPAIVSHITSYNTKVDKIMDTLIYQPGIDLFRGSDCFVYWCDPQKGLTWGLNFITAEDASYFLDVVCGNSRGVLSRRANSTQSLTEKQNGGKQKGTTSSTPATPDHQHQTRRPTVTFAEVPTTFSANSLATTPRTVSSSTDHIQHLHEELVTAAAGWIGKPSVLSPQFDERHRPSPQLDERRRPSPSLPEHHHHHQHNGTTGIYDNLTDLAIHRAQIENEGNEIWQKQRSSPPVGHSTVMHMSLDSNTLKRMIDPLPCGDVGGANWSKNLSNSVERLQNSNGHSPSSVCRQQQQIHGRSSSFRHGYRNNIVASTTAPASNHSPFVSSSTPSCSSSMSANSVDTGTYTIGAACTDVTLKQNDRRFSVVSTPKNKRCSIYLNTNTAKINAKNGEPILMSVKDLNTVAVADDSNSLTSSMDGTSTTTSSQSSHVADVNGLKSSPSSMNNKIKKAGHIVMKKWLQPQENGIEILCVENWKRFWCCLKGYCIYFYNVLPSNLNDLDTLNRSNGVDELCLSSDPVMSIDLLNCLAQALPEYPRREHVFSLTSGSGQSFLLQVSSDAEVDNWVQTIHTAGAMALARTQSKDVAQKAVRKELERLEQKLDSVNKMVKMSQLPSTLGTVTGYQMDDWDDELELLHVQHFMVKCYWAALKCQDSPSCKKMLTSATKNTKAHLSRLGAFTSSSMHAYVLVKSSGKMRSSCSSPIRPHQQQQIDGQYNHRQLQNSTTTPVGDDHRNSSSTTPTHQQSSSTVGTSQGGKLFKSRASLVQITLPNQQVTVVSVGDMETVAAVLQKACEKASLKVDKCFLLLRRITTPGESHVPNDNEILQPKIATHQVEIRERLIYHVHLSRLDAQDRIFGLTIRAQKFPTKTRMTVTITNVDDNGLAKRAGLIIGDELLAINEQHVSSLISSEIEQILQESSTLCMVLRTKRIALPAWLEPMNYAGSNESLKLTCSNDKYVSVQISNNVILPEDEEESENWFSDSCNLMQNKIRLRNAYRTSSLSVRGRQRLSLPVIPSGAGLSPQHRDSVSAHSSPNHFDQQRNSTTSNVLKRISSSEPGNIMSTGYANGGGNGVGASRSASIKVGTTERLEKILFELVETEKAYVKDLETLVQIYLQPLQNERLLPTDDVERLLISSFAIVKFQKSFLEELLEVVGDEKNDQQTVTYSSPNHLRNALVHLGGVFLTSASGFKVYSSFCAAYFRFSKVLRSEEQNENLQRFLLTTNVKRQHSSTLESYLIKPVQRVLRYPLFLQQIKTLTNPNQPEHMQISDALLKMEKVAEYINEMQRIYEEYGALFSQIQSQNKHIQDTSFELCDLLMFGEVDWLNSNEDQNKKKLIPLECLCFVFKSAILLMSQENKRPRKSKSSNGEKQTMYRFIPINELEINGSDVGSSDTRFIWILIHLDPVLRVEKVYHFANKRQEAKQQFLKAIRRAGVLMTKQNGTQKSSNNFKSTPSPQRSTKNSASKNSQVQQIANGGIGDVNVKIKRPTSYHSNQSDPGYGSSTNGEAQKRLM